MDIYRPEDAFGMNLQTFKLFGVWPAKVKHPILRLLYQIYGYGFHLFYIVAVLPAQFINIYLIRGDVQKLVESSFFTLTCVAYVVKLVVFLLRRTEIEEFFERLHGPIFFSRQIEHLIVLKNSVVIAKASSMSLMILVMLTCVCWILFPLVDSTQDKVLLFAAWYPFDTSVESVYRYIYVLQTILLLTTAAMNAMMDMLTTNFYVVMVGQLEILKQDFKQMTDIVLSNVSDTSCKFPSGTVTADKKLASHQEGKASDPTSYSVSGEEMQRHRCLETTNTPEDTFCYEGDFLEKILNERVAKCTIRHEAILTFINDVRNLFQIGIVAQICASSIIICVTCFELTLISPATLQFYVVMQYQMCMLVEIFIYTWRGNDITVKTAELKDAVYECAWSSIPNKKFRKSLCIILSRLQIPVKVFVGKFFLLSVDTFFNILRLAYSFYILLKQINIRNE